MAVLAAPEPSQIRHPARQECCWALEPGSLDKAAAFPLILMRCRHWNPYAVRLGGLGRDKELGKTTANPEQGSFIWI